MEQMIGDRLVNFPDEPAPALYQSVQEITKAIVDGSAPPYLSEESDLEFWVGKKIAFGRPRFKRFKDTLVNESMPLSSWCVDLADPQVQTDSVVEMSVGRTSEGTMLMRELGMAEAFNYAKPLSLIKNLLAQATRPGDIVLDFFAGSGTTGQAVLELNAEDGGQRRFILCSSTEATAKEPDKNLCRDVCAERMRRVMAGYGNKPALGGSFAYLQLDLLDAADVAFEASADHAALLLALRELQALPPQTGGAVRQLAGDAQLALLLCPEVTPQTLETLANWPAERLAVYSPRPDTVRDWLQQAGKPANSYSLLDALLRGQTSLRAK